MRRRFSVFLRRILAQIAHRDSVPAILAILALAIVLAWSGWFRAFRQATLATAIVMALSLLVVLFAAFALWPSVSHLLSQLFYGDPYWIKPREFDAEDDPRKTEALLRRLEILEADQDARFWRDRESGQYWISRRFERPEDEFVRFKPLASRAHWRGMADADWTFED